MKHTYKKRDYQLEANENIFAQLTNAGSTLIVMATGTGKTEVYIKFVEEYLRHAHDQRALIVAHREELITQPMKRWRRDYEEWPAIEMAELRANSEIDQSDMFDSCPTNKRVVIASIQSLNSGRRCKQCTADCQNCEDGKVEVDCESCDGSGKYEETENDCYKCKGTGRTKQKCDECNGDTWICIQEGCDVCFEHFVRRMQGFEPSDFGLLVIDEAHHCTADTYTRLIRWFRNGNRDIKILGCTATPDRADEEALGQIFETVAYEYNLPNPIYDGWLTPVDQQYILIEELSLANVRTTAGDLNSGDLEREMMVEKVLHKVTTPLVEIACGLEKGTIGKLIQENRIHELQNLCTKHEPTLVHAVDVAHAQRMTEIINRYLPNSALCIIGTTPKDTRRDGLKKFAEGEYQFLLSCGVFLEGTDLPNVSIVGMARPTKSRALYSQMLGRGLRPLSGLVDGIETAEERCELIKNSAKPTCLAIDFVGNSGRHKLISSADILGDSLPDELVQGVIRKAARDGKPIDMLRALNEAKEKADEDARKKRMQDAKEREAREKEAQRRATEQRQGIVAGATYSSQTINPFDVYDIAAEREPGYHKGKMPTDKMKETLTKAGVPWTEKTTFWEASLLIKAQIDRWQKNLCSYKQAKLLQKYGYSGNETRDEAKKLIDSIAANGWRRP